MEAIRNWPSSFQSVRTIPSRRQRSSETASGRHSSYIRLATKRQRAARGVPRQTEMCEDVFAGGIWIHRYKSPLFCALIIEHGP